MKKLMKNKQLWIVLGSVMGGLLVGLVIVSFNNSNLLEDYRITGSKCLERMHTGGTGMGQNRVENLEPIRIEDYEEVISSIEYGSALAIKDTNLTLEDMLTYAIQDEYLARKEYEKIIDKYGAVRPFSNIINAENNHIEELKKLFEANKIAIPEDKSSSYVVLPSSLTAAYQAGVDAEVLNIRMYDLFLNEALDENVRITFEALKKASENHLRAFERKI